MRPILLLLALALPAHAQVYQWTDEQGAVHYSDASPPEGTTHRQVGALARGGFVSGPGYPLPIEHAPAQLAEAPRPAPLPEPRGLDFRKYVALYRGMSEGELLGIAGEPDFHSSDRSFSTYTYMPTRIDPYTTTINLVRGRVSEIERVRRF
ncbi:MAG TPA: DUF4124 domain-containing protein [Burkholderiales bacterium]|nr:DUF4124 domain-containing protein [Burkholderiales bacterium]